MMNAEDYEFLLSDRVAKIKALNEQYDLENNAYLSFSGGKDSVIVHHLLDIALPGNKIPRLFVNTGVEYKLMLKYVFHLAESDERILIYNSGVNLKKMLSEVGYPFKSKEHANRVEQYQKTGLNSKDVQAYLGLILRPNHREHPERAKMFSCPKILRYQFTPENKLKISSKCCLKLKKEVAHRWQEQCGRKIVITGLRKSESAYRKSVVCTTFSEGNLKSFNPLAVVSDEFESEFILQNNIKLCELYYPPFNFKRTGCKGCPFSADIKQSLETMKKLLPSEYKQCEILWKPVYDEYRRIGYRLTESVDKNTKKLF